MANQTSLKSMIQALHEARNAGKEALGLNTGIEVDRTALYLHD